MCSLPHLLGLDVDGIYRVSGNLAVVQKLRFLVDRGEACEQVVVLRTHASELLAMLCKGAGRMRRSSGWNHTS